MHDMSTEHQIGIHIDVPRKVSDAIKSVSRDFGISHPSGELEPHITLYYSKFNPDKFSTLVRNLELHNIEPFKVTLGEICGHYSDSRDKVFYTMRLANPEPVLKLHERVLKVANNLRGDLLREKDIIRQSEGKLNAKEMSYLKRYGSYRVLDNFHPHITLGVTDNTDERVDDKIRSAYAPLIGTKFNITNLTVCLFLYDNHKKTFVEDVEKRYINFS